MAASLTLTQTPLAIANDSTGGLAVTDWSCIQPSQSVTSYADMFIGNLTVGKPKMSRKGMTTSLVFTKFSFSNMKGNWNRLNINISQSGNIYYQKSLAIKDISNLGKINIAVTLPTKYLTTAEFIINLQSADHSQNDLNGMCIPTRIFRSRIPVNNESALKELSIVNKLAATFISNSGSGAIPSNINIKIDPKITNSLWTKNSIATISSADQILDGFGLHLVDPLNLYISWGPEFRNKYTPVSCHYDAGGGSCGNGDIWADLQWFAGKGSAISAAESTPDALSQLGIAANIPHELAHEAQQLSGKTAGNPDYWKIQPAWYREGSAEFFKLLAYSKATGKSYESLHSIYAASVGKFCSSVHLSDLTSQGSYSNGCEYSKGIFAVEYLMSKTGNIKLLFTPETKMGGDFSQVFAESYGLNLSQFSAEVDSYFDRVVSLA